MSSLLGLPSRIPVVRSVVSALFSVMALSVAPFAATADDAVAPPPPAVDVLVLEPESVRTWVEFSGRLAPVESAKIRPLVGGVIQKVLFAEGQQVEQGQPLFVIDPRPHQAAVAEAEARLAVAQSRAQLAQDELKRSQQLVNDKLISQSIYDAARSAKHVADADVKQAEAVLSQQQLNLEYAHITAPISGRVSRAELTAGNVVDAGINAPVLTEIVATNQLFAEFNVDEATYIEFVRSVQDPQQMPVKLTLARDSDVVYEGRISSFDNRLDPTSGTIRARAVIDNRDGALTAGMFANVRLGAASINEVLLVPSLAVSTNQSKKFVLVVDDTNTATYREVTLGEYYQGRRVVAAGLSPGERVIVNGLSHVRPNTVVAPREVATEVAAAH
ncbi:efflux RND transporter periplasmic adaptor subunit [Gilvimarinus sp. DA14]|uniref:efflux RND transporter periplasmic adaptor subunit n=1 Tax=Gilvimarinus sp. DA14 TaxID=2956798 RepID=UPI0020B6791B|nr:efflux RND transporter periplasmic adaptor subunit [Gilvimarinus sp. DA14]UTF59142.1 efflux RND transporter periplasmic adaptor subunit [Gilvimarinus sp. DA14]